MKNWLQAAEETAAFLRNKGVTAPAVGIVLGTGLGEMVNMIAPQATVDYHDIPHFPVSTVEFHKGKLIYGTIGAVQVLAMQGRFHYYEGYSMQEITFPIRVMKALGVSHLLLSNAAGGMDKRFAKGDLVLIDDHINLLPENPLRGLSDPAYGPRFTDMSAPYDDALSNMIAAAAAAHGVQLHRGVYVAVQGPNLETRAEYRYLHAAGATMVGMSTVPEVIVANQCGIPCAAVSVITDECDPDNLHAVNIDEIIAVAGKSDKVLSAIFKTAIESLKTN